MTTTADVKDEVIERAMAAQAAALEVVDAALDGADDVTAILAATRLTIATRELNELLRPVAMTRLIEGKGFVVHDGRGNPT